MPPNTTDDPDAQAAQLIAYSLRTNGWVIDKLTVDDSGVQLVAHRTTRKGSALTRSGFRELEE